MSNAGESIGSVNVRRRRRTSDCENLFIDVRRFVLFSYGHIGEHIPYPIPNYEVNLDQRVQYCDGGPHWNDSCCNCSFLMHLAMHLTHFASGILKYIRANDNWQCFIFKHFHFKCLACIRDFLRLQDSSMCKSKKPHCIAHSQ